MAESEEYDEVRMTVGALEEILRRLDRLEKEVRSLKKEE